MNINQKLSPSSSLNVSALCRTFSSTTNSYKLLFFRALLSIVESKKSIHIDPQEIVNHMLTDAWVPSVYFKLCLGKQDKINAYLNEMGLLNFNLAKKDGSLYQSLFSEVSSIDRKNIRKSLLQYVPFRMLQPFYSNELKGIADAKKNKLTSALSITSFDLIKPLYKIEYLDNSGILKITLHQEWLDYLIKNLPIIKAWVELNWLQYLQTKNPHTPALSNKLAFPQKRYSLQKQRVFWDDFIRNKGLACLFSNTKLSISNYEVDHFIPWTYVAHNQCWNLIPILSNVNSSKSNKLPIKGVVSEQYVETQFQAIMFARKIGAEFVIDDFLVGLQCGESDLFNFESFNNLLLPLINNLNDSAAAQGFERDWEWEHYT